MPAHLVISDLRGAIIGPMSLTVPEGSCAAISGPSGAGKSLFLRMIADLDPNEGQVRLGDLDRAAVTAPVWRRQVVYLAAEAGWWGATVDLHVPEELRPAAIDMARRLDLDADYFQRPVASLSTGERQRLALVRALVRRPKALLLDEPSSALDAAGIARVESLLRDTLDTGAAMILVTHDPEQGRRLGTAHYEMTAGRLKAVAPLPTLHPIP